MEPRGWGVERAAWAAAATRMAAAASVPISLSSLPVEPAEPMFGAKVLDDGKDVDNFVRRVAGAPHEVVPNEFSPRISALPPTQRRRVPRRGKLRRKKWSHPHRDRIRTDRRVENSLGTRPWCPPATLSSKLSTSFPPSRTFVRKIGSESSTGRLESDIGTDAAGATCVPAAG